LSSNPGLYIVAAPSGGGKSSLIRALLERDHGMRLSVSHTTRPARPGEKDGVHYHFVSPEAFLELVSRDAFLEHARVFDHYYGTARNQVERQLASGHDVLLDIDWQGARQVKHSFPSARSIFILPPSMAELRERLTLRGQDSAAVIDRRMRDAGSEISHWKEFDYVIVNDDFTAALSDLEGVVRNGAPIRAVRQEQIKEILADFPGTG
jgi:guanylate kinase